jgi:hypothetical protein
MRRLWHCSWRTTIFVHETLRITPAMALGVTDHIWTIGELINAATPDQPPAHRMRAFTVIQGGR